MNRIVVLILTLALLIFILFLRNSCATDDYPPLGRVRGRVLLDGKPLPAGLIVLFKPKIGRPASGNTDADGYFDMVYRKKRGAIVGNNHVSLQWPTGFPNAVAFPADYGGASEIFVDVKPGRNEFNIEMKSDE